MAYLNADYAFGFVAGKVEQPRIPTNAVVDKNHGLARGLVGAFLFNENGGVPKNYANPIRTATVTGTGFRKEYTQGGRGFAIDGSGTILDYRVTGDYSYPNGFSVSVYAYISDGGVDVISCGSYVQGQGEGVRLLNNVGQPVFYVLCRTPAATGGGIAPSTQYQANGPFNGANLFQKTNSWWTGVYTPEQDIKIYSNTRLMGTTVLGSGVRTVNGIDSTGWASGRNTNFTGTGDQAARLYAVFIHERPLTASEVEALHSDYSQLFIWPGRKGRAARRIG